THGHMWVHALSSGTAAGWSLSAVHKVPGALAPDWAGGSASVWCPPRYFGIWVDKPFFWVGPRHSHPEQDTMYCGLFRKGSYDPCTGTLWGKRSLDSGLPGSSWDPSECAFHPIKVGGGTCTDCGTMGLGVSLVMVPRAAPPAQPGPTAGRVVGAWQGAAGNGDLPSTGYSDDEALTWQGDGTGFVSLDHASGVGLLRGITDFDFPVLLNAGSTRNFPALAVDARNPNHVVYYAAFLAVPA